LQKESPSSEKFSAEKQKERISDEKKEMKEYIEKTKEVKKKENQKHSCNEPIAKKVKV